MGDISLCHHQKIISTTIDQVIIEDERRVKGRCRDFPKNDYVSVWISISQCSSLHVKTYMFSVSRIDSIFIIGGLLNHNSTARIQIVRCICLFFWLKKTNKLEWSAHKGITTYRHRLHVDNHSAEGVSLRSARRFSYMSPFEFPSKFELRISSRESVSC